MLKNHKIFKKIAFSKNNKPKLTTMKNNSMKSITFKWKEMISPLDPLNHRININGPMTKNLNYQCSRKIKLHFLKKLIHT